MCLEVDGEVCKCGAFHDMSGIERAETVHMRTGSEVSLAASMSGSRKEVCRVIAGDWSCVAALCCSEGLRLYTSPR